MGIAVAGHPVKQHRRYDQSDRIQPYGHESEHIAGNVNVLTSDHGGQRGRSTWWMEAAQHRHRQYRRPHRYTGGDRQIGNRLEDGHANQRRNDVASNYGPWLRQRARRHGENQNRRRAKWRNDDREIRDLVRNARANHHSHYDTEYCADACNNSIFAVRAC